MAKIININDSNWDNYIKQTPQRDIHFSQKYLKLFEKHLDAQCQMFIYGNEEKYYMFPFFKRKIDTSMLELNNKNFYDIISPWYYGGPLIYGNPSEKEIEKSLAEFCNYCKDNHIISGFSYFNPYLENYRIVNKFVNIEDAGEVVYVDLKRDVSDIFENSFSNSCRRAIRKGGKIGIKVNFKNDDKYLKAFYDLYINSMELKKARDFFKFPFKFLSDLRDIFYNNFILITVEYKDRIVGGDIFLYKYSKMYYYLGARNPEYPEANPSNRIFYEAIKYGKEKGLQMLDLGGGHKSLLNNKKSFSKTIKPKYVLKQIFLEDAYKELCVRKGINDIKGLKADFFPEYRKEVDES